MGDEQAAGQLSGVHSTPTPFINGIKREGLRTLDELKTLVTQSAAANQ